MLRTAKWSFLVLVVLFGVVAVAVSIDKNSPVGKVAAFGTLLAAFTLAVSLAWIGGRKLVGLLGRFRQGSIQLPSDGVSVPVPASRTSTLHRPVAYSALAVLVVFVVAVVNGGKSTPAKQPPVSVATSVDSKAVSQPAQSQVEAVCDFKGSQTPVRIEAALSECGVVTVHEDDGGTRHYRATDIPSTLLASSDVGCQLEIDTILQLPPWVGAVAQAKKDEIDRRARTCQSIRVTSLDSSIVVEFDVVRINGKPAGAERQIAAIREVLDARAAWSRHQRARAEIDARLKREQDELDARQREEEVELAARRMLERDRRRFQEASAEPQMDINSVCRDEWGTNYRMQEFCRQQHQEARSWARSRSIAPEIASQCAGDWPSNWRMFAFCVKTQEQAKARL